MAMECVPRWLKLTYTVLVVVLVPLFAWEYGLANFLWFSNIAVLGTLAAIWLDSRLLLSMMALAAIVPDMGWNIAFLARLLFDVEMFGVVGYMFDPRIPLWARAISLYHVPLPFLLVWLVWRRGYDPRAIYRQTGLAIIVLILSYLVSEPYQNINMVYGPLDERRQPVVPPPAPLFVLLVVLPLIVYLPTHVVLTRWFRNEGKR